MPAVRERRTGLAASAPLFIGALVSCAVVYAVYGADAGLFSRERRLGSGGGGGAGTVDINALNANLFKGKAFQRIPESRTPGPTPQSTPEETPSGTPPASSSGTPAGTPAATGTPSGTASKSKPPPVPKPEAKSESAGEKAAPASAVAAARAASDYKEDSSLVARMYPTHQALPSPPAADKFSDHPDKYLMLVQGQEGFGAWYQILWEMLDLARTLNRSFVEPCVRNSCLEPCRCGAVHDVRVPDSDLHLFDEGQDPLNLKFDPYPCEPYTGHHRNYVGWAWPLSVYLDMTELRSYYPHIVRYQDWCDNVMAKDTSVKVNEVDKRWHVTQGAFCGELHAHWCDLGTPKKIGDFYFDDFQFGRPGSVPDAGIMDTLHTEPYHTIFYYGYYRGYFLSPRRDTNVPFHPGHHRAVQHFIRTHFGTAPLTVFHWRSEHVDESMLVPCAHDLAGVVSQFDWPATPSGYRGLLMSDMPAPNNNHIMWHTYTSSNNNARHDAMEAMTGPEGRLIKLDSILNDTDTGVLMIRDFLLGVYADQYITCQGDFIEECLGCFRSNSNFIVRILAQRRLHSKRFMTAWWKMGKDDLPAGAGQRQLVDVRV